MSQIEKKLDEVKALEVEIRENGDYPPDSDINPKGKERKRR